MKHFDLVIVGASFAGLTLAKHLPSEMSILIIDRKKKLNSICESTGLVTTKTKELLEVFVPDIRRYLTNDCDTLGVITTDFETCFFSKADKPWIYSTDTPELLAHLGRIQGPNVTILLDSEFIGFERLPNSLQIKVKCGGNEIEVFETDFLVGADGSRSRVAEFSGLDRNKRFLLGYEKHFYGQILLGPSPSTTVYHYWFGEFSLGYGGWLSPTAINGRSSFRLGLAKLAHNGKDLKMLDVFISRLIEKKHIQVEGEVVNSFAGQVPIGGTLKNIYADRVLLIGDAAGLCGAFAADGIKGAIVSGQVAATGIVEFLKTKNHRIFSSFLQQVNEHERLVIYFRKQLLYRFVWDGMKSNSTFKAMFDIIEQEKETFINQFSNAKNTGGGLGGIILKPKLYIKLAKFLFLWLRDFLFIK